MSNDFDPAIDDQPDTGTERVASDLQLLYEGIAVPSLRFRAAPEATTIGRRPRLAWPRGLMGRLLVGAGAAGVAAGVLVGVLLWPSKSNGVVTSADAAEILQRSSAAVSADAAPPSTVQYHVVARETSNDKGGGTTETWFQDASHFRSEQWVAGDRVGPPTFGAMRDGSDVWIYSTDAGGARAVHGDAQVLGIGAADKIQGAPSMSELLAVYSQGGCFMTTVSGTDTVLGRTVDVITVRPTPESCNPGAATAKIGFDYDAITTVWVDEATFIPLRLRVVHSADDRLLVDYEVSELETGADAPAADFQYHAPPGVHVVEAADVLAAKGALSPRDGSGHK